MLRFFLPLSVKVIGIKWLKISIFILYLLFQAGSIYSPRPESPDGLLNIR